jgi:nucleoside-diphosphate-sugar epimerase
MSVAHHFPAGFADVEALEDFMSQPSAALIDDLASVPGDIMVLGVGGKMGPTLARMAKRAAPGKRVIGVARFSDPSLARQLERHGIETIACNLLDRQAIAALPGAADGVSNIVFMAGHKFGANDNPSFTWAMNVAVPWMVAEHFRDCRIVTFSTACVYPFVDVKGPGANEGLAAVPPPGDYANSCVGREKMFEHGSRTWGTPGRLVRLSYAIDMRYGVLRDVADAVFNRRPLDLRMGYADVIWQGDANEQSLRLLAHCTSPASAINITGPAHVSIRWLAKEFARRFGRDAQLTGTESDTAWLLDTRLAQQLFGPPSVPLQTMIDWVADWVSRGGASLGKPTHFEARDGKY